MAAVITTKDGTEYKCLGGDKDEMAKKVNDGAKMILCGGKWIASSTISTISIESPEEPDKPRSAPRESVLVYHNHYYTNS